MRLITQNNIVNVSGDTEASGYPSTNALSGSPGDPWKSTGTTATFSIVCGAADMLVLVGCNAITATASFSVDTYMEWSTEIAWDSNIAWAAAVTPPTQIHATGLPSNIIKFEYSTAATGTHVITLSLTAPAGESVEIGEVIAGPLLDITGPRYGFKEDLVDYSIVKRYASGGVYVRKRDIVRSFNASMVWDLETEFEVFYDLVTDTLGQQNTFWELVTTDDSFDVYGHLSGMPGGSHKYLSAATNSMKILEVK